MPPYTMPSTLPAIVPPRIGPGAQELNTSYSDERGFALSGLSAASAVLRGALFEATSRTSHGSGGGGANRPLSATTIALMMSPGPMGPGGQTGSPLLIPGIPGPHPPGNAPTTTNNTRGSPGSILGFLSGAAGGGGSGTGGGGGGGLAQEAVQSATALRAAAEGLVEALEAAVRAREAQNRALLTATKESAAGGVASAAAAASGGGGGGRPASARALDRALAQSASCRTPRLPSAGPSGSGLAVVASSPSSATEERLGWVRALVRSTEGGQAYAAAAEEREKERERERRASGGDGGEASSTPSGLVRRGPLPALRPSRREDVLLLQAWLADMLHQVAAGGAVRQQQAAFNAAAAAAASATAAASSSSSGSAAAAAAVSEPGIAAQHAADLADGAMYVVGMALEELRRQVAAECRERGELLGHLVDHQAALVALRGALAAEGRVAEASAQWAALLAEREVARQKERERGRAPQDEVAAADFDAAVAAASSSSVSTVSNLAAQLVAAHHAVEAAERRFQLADAALAGEAGRRAAAEQQLEATRELLRRQEHEWLHHRAINQRLENEVQALKDKTEAAARNAAVAEATVEAAREQTRIGRDDVSQLEAALARMRQQYEGNEILVAAQRQQIRELESALAALREQHREQALALGKVGKVTEKYEETVADLRADLTALQERAAELESDLSCRTARLSEVEERLATCDADLAAVRSQLATTEAEAAKAASEAEAVQRQMRHEITDAVAARRQEETRRIEVEKETSAMTEMTKMLARTMQLQGTDGVPGISDRSWEATGPLGAAQRVLGLATQHIGTLYGSREDVTRELRTLQVKMAEEKDVNAKLQRELYDARTTETRMIREKEVLEMKVANLEHDLRASLSDATRSKAMAQDGEVKLKMQHETIVALQAQARELVPLKKRVEALSSDLECSRSVEEDLRNSLDVTRRGLEQSEEQSRYYQNEMHKLQHEVGCLQDSIKGLKVKEAKLAEAEGLNQDLKQQILDLKHQLDVTAESHTDTIRQLELAKFFLQGLDSTAPASPGRSSSTASPLRDPPTSHSRSPSRTLTMTYNISQSGRFGSPPGRLFRASNAVAGGGIPSMPYPDGAAAPFGIASVGVGSGAVGGPSLENAGFGSGVVGDASLASVGVGSGAVGGPALENAGVGSGALGDASLVSVGVGSGGVGGAALANAGGGSGAGGGASLASVGVGSGTVAPSPFANGGLPHLALGPDGRPISAISQHSAVASTSPRSLSQTSRPRSASHSNRRSFRRPGSAITETVPEDPGEYDNDDDDGTLGMGPASEGGGVVGKGPRSPLTRNSRAVSAGAAASRRGGIGGGSAVSGGSGSGSGGTTARSPRVVSRINSMGLSLDSRPMSGFGPRVAGPEDDDDYGTEVSTVVMDIIESRGLTHRIHRSTNKWTSVKIGVMAWFSRRLRERLLQVSEQLAAKDLEIAQLHYNYMSEMRQREEFIVTEMLPTLLPAMESGLKDSQRELQQVRAELPAARRDLDALAGACAVLGFSLQGYRDRETHAVCVGCQTDTECPDEWYRYANHLPPLPPRLILSPTSLVETIVRIYVRAAGTVEEVPTWGAPRHDTIHDAIMAHYTSQKAAGTFKQELLQDPESPIARLLASAVGQSRNTKVAGFLYFMDLSPEGVHWPAATWHFFLHLLHCLRVLLSGTWRIVTKRWATLEGVQIPMPAVLDLVGNLFNVQTPGELDGALSVRLAAIVTPGVAGPAVDLDALLLLLIREYNAGNCPRNALLFPRRLTDGQLFNIFNSLGHNTHLAALKSALAGQYIGPTAPASPTAGGTKLVPSSGRQAPPQASAAAAAVPPPPPLASEMSAAAYGASLLTATGDIMHPYGGIGEAPRGNVSAVASPTLQEQRLYGGMPGDDDVDGGGGAAEADAAMASAVAAAAEAALPRQGVRWGPPVPSTVQAPGSHQQHSHQQQYQPNGQMTINFQISHDQHSSAVVSQATAAGPAAAGAMQGWAVSGGWAGDGATRLTALPPPPPRPRKY